MYTERELPLLVARSKPVLSSIYPFSKVFAGQTSRPPTERTFTLSGNQGRVVRGIGLGAVFILGLLFLGRS